MKKQAQLLSQAVEKNDKKQLCKKAPLTEEKKKSSFNSVFTHWTIVNEDQQQMVDSVLQENTVQN